MARRRTASLFTTIACVSAISIVGHAQSLSLRTRHVPGPVLAGQTPSVGRLSATESLRLVFVLPLRNQEALDSFLENLYDPTSPSYRQFLTVEQFTSMFGPSQEDYDQVIRFARANGFTVVGTSRNRLNIDVTASVSTIEQALHLTMNQYRDAIENRTFYAPDREPTPNIGVPLWHIAGLDNHSVPRPALRRKNPGGAGPNAITGSGPSNSFLGSDMRAAYYGGTLTGTGQSVGLLEFLGTDLADLTTYYKNIGQKNNVPITVLSVDGTSTTCLASKNCDDTEQTIDMTQALGMAPGLSSLVMYVGSTDVAMFNAMATANPLNAQLSSSWTWSPADPNTVKPYFQEFAAQGQNLFQAAGDSGVWAPGAVIFPADDALVTTVGGTDLQTASAGGPWSSETVWLDGGGGISPNHLAIPSWQTIAASGCPSCSQTFRNGPDVSANANFSFYVCADQTTCSTNLYGGTSFAAPMWAGYMALINQAAVANSGRPRGFINPSLYAIGASAGYSASFHDITVGSNGVAATIGFDPATGWGSPNGSGLLNALIAPPNFSLSATPASQSVVQGTSFGYTATVTPSGGFGGNVTMSVSGLPSGTTATFSPNPIAGYGPSTMNVSVGATTPLGTYPLTITASGGSINQTTSVSLTVIPPPIVVVVAPTVATLIPGQTQQFTVTVSNTNNTAVTWSLNPSVGTISTTGLYTPPSNVSTQESVIATATSVADTTKSASATITLLPATAWLNGSWTNRKTITIDHTKVSGGTNLTNFPVLVSLTDPNLATVANGGSMGKNDGTDIFFTAADGITKLSHEIESYSPTTGQVTAWVQVPSISTSANTVLFLYYGNPAAANQQNPAGVWDNNYEAVWHLANGVTLAGTDSTGNANNATTLNGTTPTAGQIDGAASFNGTSNFIQVPASSSLNGWTQQTVSAWIKAQTNMVTFARLIEKGANNEWTLSFANRQLTLENLGTNQVGIATSAVVADNTWHKIDATMDNNSRALAIYVDGVLNVSGTSTNSAPATNNNLSIGQYGGGGYYYHGLLDEVRISNSIRSAGWIATAYNNESSPATFVSEGIQQNSPAVAPPSFSPPAGTLTSPQPVTLSTTTPGASIRYTTDGSMPSETAGILYSGPITISSPTTVNAIAYASGMTDSPVVSATYTFAGLNWFGNSWTNRKSLRIAHGKVSGSSNLINFPVLVSLTDPSLATLANGGLVGKSDGGDILFTASDGATQLAHEVETYSPATGQLIAWVNVPVVSPSNDTVIYMYYGNAGAADQQNPAGVWDSHYEGVWHLPNGVTLSGGDSTGNANNPATLNGTTAAIGQIDGAASFNGTSNYIQVAASSSLNGWTQQTVSAWIKAQTDMALFARLIEKGANNEWTLSFANQQLTIENLGTNSVGVTTNTAVADNTWHKIDATMDNNTRAIAIYVDGVLNVSGASTSSAPATTNNLSIGQYGGGGYYYHGQLDELRISNIVRSAAWIATEYNNESSPASFATEGTQENSPAVAPPSFGPAGGTYTSALSVALSTTTPGASIRYTTDGTTPSETAGTLYSGPITISSATTVKAVAYASGMIDSSVVTASYTISGLSWYNNSWTNRKSLRIAHGKVGGTTALANFPVLVSLTDPNLATVANGGLVGKNNGGDILFTASDGATQLAHEIESYNAATGQLIAWVNVASVSPVSDTIIYMYYGNAAVSDQQNPGGVWDGHYEGVWHLPNGITLSGSDSTSNANNPATLNGTTAATGQVDGAASFNGTSNYIQVPASGSLNNWTQQTVSAWIKAQTDMVVFARLIEKGANSEWTLSFANQLLTLENLGASSVGIETNVAVADNTWHKIDATMDNNTRAIAIYVDGVLNVSGTSATSAPSTTNNLSIGQYGGGGYYYHGLLDELRISNIVRSAAWIATEYNNESSPASFVTEGTQENSPAVAPPSFSPAGGTYTSPQSVTLKTTTPGASIRYTTDGTTPSETAGILYNGPITISSATTVIAIAYASGMIDSAVVTASYTISGLSWYNNAWTNRKSLRIAHGKVGGAANLTNFPVLVSVTDPNLATVANGGLVGKSNGGDILFTASDGATQLAHEIEGYNATTGQLIAWVNVPVVSPSSDTIIYLYYGNAAASDQQNPAGVWDGHYEGVWHLPNGVTLSGSDSTSNANNAASLNGATAATGQVDGAASFNGTSNFMQVPASSSLNGWTQQTISAWIKAQTDMVIFARLIEKGANNEWTLSFANQLLTLENLGTNSVGIETNLAVADNTWHKIDATMDNNTRAIAIYVDGVLNVSGTSATSASGTTNNLSIGQYGGGGYYYHGLLDELRISNIVRSAGWIATEFNNESSPATFLSEGAQETHPH